MARDNPCAGGGMLPLDVLLRDVISVEEEPFCDECFPPLIASKQEQQAPIIVIVATTITQSLRRLC